MLSYNLGPITTLSNTTAAVYTNPVSISTALRGIQLHNTAATAQTVELYEVGADAGDVGEAADTNRFFKQELAPNETRWINFPAVLSLDSLNDTIQGKTTTTGAVTIKLFGGTQAA